MNVEMLNGVATVWVGLIVLVQSVVFLFSTNDGLPLWKSYLASWAKTLRVMCRFFVVGNNAQERKESLVAWGLVVLSLPGALLVSHFFARIAA